MHLPKPTACRKVGQKTSGEKENFPMKHQSNFFPKAKSIVNDLLELALTLDTPRKQESLELARSWTGVTLDMEVQGTSVFCKVDGNINSAKYQEILLPPITSPVIKGVRFYSRMEHLAAPCHTSETQAPLWTS
jgi:hypothetical protein